MNEWMIERLGNKKCLLQIDIDDIQIEWRYIDTAYDPTIPLIGVHTHTQQKLDNKVCELSTM